MKNIFNRNEVHRVLNATTGLALAGGVGLCVAASLDVAGGTADNPTDITANVLANRDLNFTGGAYIVRIPVAGTAGLTSVSAAETAGGHDMTVYGSGHFVDPATPTILYRGVLSGVGALTVTNLTSASNPAAGGSFNGGLLALTEAQTFRNGTDVGLTVDPNTTVALVAGGSIGTHGGTKINVTNNGYLYSWNTLSGNNESEWGSIHSTIAGAGVLSFESGNRLGANASYSGNAYVLNGTHVSELATFVDAVPRIVQSNIVGFETRGPKYPLALRSGDAAAAPSASVYSGDFYSFGVDTQFTGGGIQIMNGVALSALGSTKKDFLSPEESRKANYFGLLRGGRGFCFYIQATLQMGNGETIVDNGDGTNNTFLQTNILGTGGDSHSNGLQIGGFQSAPKDAAATPYLQAVAFNYSGTYKYDAGMNAGSTGDGQLYPLRPDHGNFIVMNPDPQNLGRAPNHLILTAPVFLHGITHIYKNAILQLGDGTVGNSTTRSLTIGGKTYSGVYSDSYGNGMILTKANAPTSWPTAAIVVNPLKPDFDIINNNGKLIVDNVPNALSITKADATVSAWIAANTLDGIVGSGSVEQIGTLALTLTGTSTYTGGTTVGAAATLLVGSGSALGSRNADGTGGDVVVKGTLKAVGGSRTIQVAGNYTQH